MSNSRMLLIARLSGLCLCVTLLWPLRMQADENYTFAGGPRYTLLGDFPQDSTSLHPVRTPIAIGVAGGIWVYLHETTFTNWWDNRYTGKLTFENDWNTTKKIDKCGHFFGGYTASYMSTELMQYGGLSYDASVYGGAALGLVFQTYVELEDGFADGWGFSWSDMGMNTLGALFHIGQHKIEALQYIHPKWQALPHSWIDAPQISTTWIDNYNAVTFWVSGHVHPLLPESAQNVVPEWLQLSVGYGITQTENDLTRRWVLGIDVDWVRLMPDCGTFGNWLFQSMNYYKLPMPAIEFGETTSVYLLYPFKL